MTGLWEVPAGWRWATMSEVARVVGGSTPKTSEPSYWGGDIPWITPDDLSGFTARYIERGRRNITQAGYDSCSTQLVPAGTVLFSSRAPIGYVAIASTPVCTSQGFKSFVCSEEVLPEYVYWYLRASTDVANRMASGTTFAELSGKVAGRLPIVVPPLDEQREIVGILEEHLTRLEHGHLSLRRASARIRAFRSSAIADALLPRTMASATDAKEASLDGQARKLLRDVLSRRQQAWTASGSAAPYRDPTSAGSEVSAPIPDGWTVASLEQLTDARRTISYGILMPKENTSDGVPYVRVKDMRGDRIDLAALHRTSPEIASAYSRSTLKAGDLLLAIRGSYGRLSEVPDELDGGNITQDTARIDVSPLINRRYIAAYLRGPTAQAYFKRVARGVAVKGVNIGDLRAMPIPLPPLEQQEAIADEAERRVSIVDELEEEVRRASLRAGALYKDLLKAAFQGRLLPGAASEARA